VIATIVAITLCAAGFSLADAATTRPNEIDRTVDAIRRSDLLAQPASALVDPNRQAAARRLAARRLPGWIVMVSFEALALAYFWSSGRAAGLRDWLRRRLRSRWLVRLLFGAGLALIARSAALLPAFYLYRVERTMGISIELTRVWFGFWVFHTVLAMCVAGLAAAVILWLVERTHQWYVYTIVVILGVSIAWAYAQPYFEVRQSALQPVSGELARQISAALERGGIHDVTAFTQKATGQPSAGAVAYGLGQHRVVLDAGVVAASTPEESVYDAAIVIGHAIHADPLFAGLIEGGIIIIFSALAVVIADRWGFRRDDDPLSRLALVGALLAVVYFGAVPVRNAALRSYDFDADRYALSIAGNRAAAVRSIVRATDQQMQEACPGIGARLFLNTRPSASARVAAINGVPEKCR
ncbi:MAG TPA: M48 family metalloprotease, partial [Candidatus Tumulicola sp.]